MSARSGDKRRAIPQFSVGDLTWRGTSFEGVSLCAGDEAETALTAQTSRTVAFGMQDTLRKLPRQACEPAVSRQNALDVEFPHRRRLQRNIVADFSETMNVAMRQLLPK
jgi:hypothetical protein